MYIYHFPEPHPSTPRRCITKPPVPWHRAVKQLARGDGMSLVQSPPQWAAFNAPPQIDLHGGTLIDTEEKEEIDPIDGCRVQVITYKIRSADGLDEYTNTIRRKFQFDLTQQCRRLNIEGNEVRLEESSQRLQGDIGGFRPVERNNTKLQLDLNNKQDAAICNVLSRVPDTFMSILSKEKDSLVKMFPDLFATMRSESTLIPTEATEVIQNPDGSTTTRISKRKEYSSTFSKQEHYINGVKQMSKTKFRAFVEYKGPEGKFQVALRDSNEDDLSEDETEDDDKTSRVLSEITDTESEQVNLNGKPKSETAKRYGKAWFAVKELVDSEQRYVEKLYLLEEIFRKKVAKDNALDKDKQAKLFSNITSLYLFHSNHFHPQLMEASRDWATTRRIANVVRKQAPFLKMYSEYTNNYDRSCRLFEDCLKKKKRFTEIVREVEKMPECEGLPLAHHLICPVQRVMRYQLLLQEYKKYLEESDADYADASAALELVLQAAGHANQMMKKLDGFGKVIEVQEQLGNSISLVSPGRELIKNGTIQKISSTTEKTEERFIFLFNDLILLASERKMIGMGKYKLRAVFHGCYTQVCEGDNLEREHSFYLRGSDGQGPQRCLELFTATQKEKSDWVERISSVIEDCRANSASFGGASERSSLCENNNQGEAKNCSDCDTEFSLWSRGVKCGKCKRKLCKKCFGRYRTESKNNRICEYCVKNKSGNDSVARSASFYTNSRKNLLAVPAKHSEPQNVILHSGKVKFRGSLGKTFDRYFVVRNNFCLYSYESDKDDVALAMLPLPGAEVKICGEKHTFSVRTSGRRMYIVTAEDEANQARWMAVIDLAANANINQGES